MIQVIWSLETLIVTQIISLFIGIQSHPITVQIYREKYIVLLKIGSN